MINRRRNFRLASAVAGALCCVAVARPAAGQASFTDSFEGKELDPFWKTSETSGFVTFPSAENPLTGKQSFQFDSKQSDIPKSVQLFHDFETPTTGTFSVWYYDTNARLGDFFSFYAMPSDPPKNGFGARIFHTDQGGGTYLVSDPGGQGTKTEAVRTRAWHLFTIESLEDSLSLSIDNLPVYKGAAIAPIQRIAMQLYGSASDPALTTFVDDFSFAAANAPDVIVTQSTSFDTQTINSLTIQTQDVPIQVSQKDLTTLTIATGIINAGGKPPATIAGGRLATGDVGYRVNVRDITLTIASSLTGPDKKLTLDGGGVLALTATDTSHDFGGGIFLNAGTLRINDDRNLGVTKEGFGNANSITFNGGTLEIAGSEFTLGNSRTLNFDQGGGALLTSGAVTFLQLARDNQLTGFGPLTKTGAGTLIVAGSNAFAGPVTVAAGVLELQVPGALGGTSPNGLRSSIALATDTRLDLHSDAQLLNFANDVSVPVAGATIDFGRRNLAAGGDFQLGALALGQGAVLNLTNGNADGSVLRWTGPVTLSGGASVDTTGTQASFDGPVQGFGDFEKSGGGILTFRGKDPNQFAGATLVSGGLLVLNKSPGVVAVPNTLNVIGGAVRLDADQQIGANSTINLAQSGAFDLNGRRQRTGTLTNTGGDFVTGAGQLLLSGGPLTAPIPGGAVPASPIPALNLIAGTTTINPGGQIVATSVLVSGGVNTVQGGGELSVGAGGLTFFGGASPAINLASHATTAGLLTLAGPVSVAGAAGTAAINSTGVLAQAGTVNFVAAEREFNVADGAAPVDMIVGANLTNGSLRKTGTGTLRLWGIDTGLTGATVSAGTLEIVGGAATPGGPITLGDGTLSLMSDEAAPVTFGSGALTVTGAATIAVNRVATGTTGVHRVGSVSIGAAGSLTTAGANRTLELSGLALSGAAATMHVAVATTINGPVTQTAPGMGLTKGSGGSATLTFAGAAVNTYTGLTRVNAGTLELAKPPGVTAVPGDLSVFGGGVRLLADQQIDDNANVTIANVGTLLDLNGHSETARSLTFLGGAGSMGVTPTGGAILRVKTLSIAATARLDIGNNRLIVDYDSPGPSPATSIRAALLSAFSGGTWLGNGLAGSASGSASMGYAEASEALGLAGGTFGSQTVDGTAVLVRRTLGGDTNLDGTVDFNDLVHLAQNYNVVDGARSWFNGDFTYDGNVDFSDLVKLAQNYNVALPADAIPGAPANFEGDLVRAFAQAPEPSSMAIVAAGIIGGLTARNRSIGRARRIR